MSDELFGGKPVIEFDNPQDRRAFLKYAAVIGVGGTLAATTASSAFAASPSPTSSGAASQFGDGDVGILQYALTLEYLEAEFYQKGVAANILGAESALIEPIAKHEAAHVQAISGTLQKLGKTPVTKPTFKFPEGTFTDKMTFLKTASAFEEAGVKAYHGQITKVQDGAILGAAASIAGVEGRHATVLNLILKQKAVPAPLEAKASMDETLQTIKPFLG